MTTAALRTGGAEVGTAAEQAPDSSGGPEPTPWAAHRVLEADAVTMHPDQLDVTVDVVRDLLHAQFPRWRSLPVRRVHASGTVNAVFRLGEHLAARLPLRPGDVAETRRVLQAEADAAQKLLATTPFPTPEPVALGEPGPRYPLPWSVQTWLPGRTAVEDDPGESVPFARDLAAFVRAVRAIDTDGRSFAGSGRGGDLRDHDRWMETCFTHSAHLLDVPRLRRVWSTLRDLPSPSTPDLMAHGDLIPGNVLVASGRLVGILDVGGLGPADPALDLVGGWHLLQDVPRQALRRDLACSDLEWARGKAWAFQQAMGAVWYYVESNPPMSRMGARTLDRILADTST